MRGWHTRLAKSLQCQRMRTKDDEEVKTYYITKKVKTSLFNFKNKCEQNSKTLMEAIQETA